MQIAFRQFARLGAAFVAFAAAAIALFNPGSQLMADVPETPEFLLTQADNAFNSYDYAKAEELYEQARLSAHDAGNLSVEIEATAQRARCNLTQDRFDSAKAWLDKTTEIASADYPSGWARYLGVKGRWEWRNGRSEAAVPIFSEMYEFATANKLAKHKIDAALMAAIVAPRERQEEWALKGIAAAEEGNQERSLGPIWNNLGWSYIEMKRFDDAVEAFTNARVYHWRFGNEMNKYWADWALGHALKLAGKYEQAESWLRPCLAWAERIGNPAATGAAQEELGDIALNGDNHSKALEYYLAAQGNYEKADYPANDPKTYEALTEKIAGLR